MAFESINTWLGVGFKVGGTLGIVGGESMDGQIGNFEYPTDVHSVTISSVRFGAGLGGGAGLVAILVFNCSSPYELHETGITDWSVNVSLGEKWSSVVKGLKSYKFFATLSRVSGMLHKATPDELTKIRNSLSYLYSAYDIATANGPSIITLDIPGAGIGEELSLNYMKGTILIGDLIHVDNLEPEEPIYNDGGSGAGAGS